MTTDIHAATQAIREALAAGPTPGPWLLATSNSWRRFVAQDMTPVCEPVTQNDGHPDLYFRNGGTDGPDARFIAACNPEAITAILAALEARDAEIAALSAQSRALRALVHHWKYYGGATNFEQMVEAAEKLLEPEARQIRGDGGKERKGC